MSKKDWGKHYHDQGQRDGSRNKFSPPNGILSEIFDTGEFRRISQFQNKKYNEGYTNGRNNRKK
jgi:hypothetical protein